MRVAPASNRERAREPRRLVQVTLRWTRADFRNGEVRAAIFSLISSFAEISTYVRQRSGDAPGGTLSFDVVTGFLDGESPYDPHGHTVRIAVSL